MRQTPDKLRALAAFLKGKMNMRSLVMTLAVLVVFVTTYLLILPAFTLEKDEAVRQGGIDVVAIETAAENEAAAETETADVEAGSEVKTVAEDEDSTDINVDADKSEKTTASDARSADVKVLTKEDGLTAEGEGFVVQATTENKTEVPANTELQVAEVSDKADELKEYREAALTALKKDDAEVKDIKEIKVYDMSLEAEGESVKTDSKFNVKIEYEEGVKVEDADNVRVLTFDAENKAAVLDAEENKVETKVESAGKKSNVTEASFETEGISKVAVVEVETLEKTIVADGKTYKVTVKYGKDAGIPDGSTLEVSELKGDAYDAYLEKTASKLDKNADELGNTKFFDITIKNGDEEVKIANPVNVSIQLVGSDNLAESTQVLHFADENKADLVDSKVSGDTVKFSADGFSVYAVVGEGDDGDYARMNLHFMNGTEEIAMMIVKNGDTRDELNHIIYDPGVGTIPDGAIFKGWSTSSSYTVADADNGMDIDEVRDWVDGLTVEENEDRYVYAMLYKNFVVNYLDENNVGVGSENVFMLSTQTSAPYTVNMAYTPKDDTHAFLGWNVSSGGTNISGHTLGRLYQNGDDITISGNVTFSVNAPEGHWLIFDENGRGGTYNAPVFLETTDRTQKPVADSAMTRFGYTFGGWYDTKEHADAHGENPSVTTGAFEFGNTISDNTTIYASWIPATRANYTIIIWKQNVAGDGYDFAETVTGTGNVGSNVPLGNTTSRNYTGFHLKETPASEKIVPEGNALVNVYYDRTEYTLNFQIQDYVYTVSTGDNDNNPPKYGDVNGQKARVYWVTTYGGQRGWSTSQYNANWYSGTVYTRSNNQSLQTVKTITALYEQNIAENFPIVGNNGTSYAGYVYEPQNSSVFTTGDVPTLETMPAESTTFRIKNYGGGSTYHLYYYLEALSGQTGDVTYDGKQYIEHQHVQINASGLSSTESEDFFDIDGYTQYASRPAYNNGRANFDNNNTIRLYYSRDSFKINYMDGAYVDGNGNKIDETKTATWGTSSDILYQADISSYNKGGTNYYAPTKAGYVFEGWYIDDACTHPYTFTTMPKGGVTVYAKWRQIQYRVFLHPNADHIADLDWGSETQAMNFRVSIGGTVSVPTGRSLDWEFVGWYTDPNCTPSSLFTSDMVLNESTVTASYDKTKDFTDPMDKWGNGATYNGDTDRFWINKKLDLYGKWRAKLVGANGIGVVYDLNGGSGNISDSNLYLDQAQATSQAAATAPEGKQFVKWVVQTWDEGQKKYVDKTAGTDTVGVYPGDSFEVLKNDAKYVITGYANPDDPTDISTTKDDTHTEIVATYTVQLRAEYVDTGAGVPTHINWYGNNETASTAGTDFVVIDNGVMINQAIEVKDPDTFSYAGHEFLGWARVPITDDSGTDIDPSLEAQLNNKNLSLAELGEEDLFLKWVPANGAVAAHYEATGVTVGATTGTTVSKVAPDERYPYHAMVAVWKVKEYDVSITKKVVGSTDDMEQSYAINYSYNDAEGNPVSSTVSLTHDETSAAIKVPYDAIFTVSETGYDDFDQTYTAARTSDDQGVALDEEVDITAETTGGFKITGNTTITVTNTKKVFTVNFKKVAEDGKTPLEKAHFNLALYNETTKKYEAYLEDGMTIGEGTQDLDVGKYQLVETKSPDGYVILENVIEFTVASDGKVTIDSGDMATASKAEGEKNYTVTIKNEPGQALPHTGGIGTTIFYILGSLLVIGCGVVLISRKRIGSAK